MAYYDTPTSRARKAKDRFEKRKKARNTREKSKLPSEDSNNWKLAKYFRECR